MKKLWKIIKNIFNKNSFNNKRLHPNSVLDKNKVVEILNLLKSSSLTQNEIAKKYGVDKSIISRIKHGKVWKSVKRF